MFKRAEIPKLDGRPAREGFEYSGGFFWVRGEDLFRRDWRGIDRNPWGVESSPGTLFPVDAGGMIFPENPIGTVEETDLYREPDIDRAEREFDAISANWPVSPGVFSFIRKHHSKPGEPIRTIEGADIHKVEREFHKQFEVNREFPKIKTRHLAYVILPVAGNGAWKKNLDQLIPHLPLFNGRKRIAILTPGGIDSIALDPPEVVQQYVRGHNCEFTFRRNNPAKREAEVWQELFEPLKTDSPNEAIFFAHAKGVTRDASNPAHRWAAVLYHACLDHWPVAEQLLSQFPICGPMKHVGQNYHRTPSKWQYLGSFYWLRSSEFFRRDWTRLDNTWAGVETMPGLHYRVEEGGMIFPSRPVSDMGIYLASYWDAIEEQFQAWSREKVKPASCPSLLSMLNSGTYSTDKNTTHTYGQFYDREFSRFVNTPACRLSEADQLIFRLPHRPVRLLEVGVQKGGSLQLWRDYFQQGEVIGVDVSLQNLQSGGDWRGIAIHHADGYDQAFSGKIGELDIAIDDGPHTLASQIRFIELYLPKIRPNGMLVIEDVQDPQHFERLKQAVPVDQRERIRCFDFRSIKGRWDDLLFVVDC
jgi:hypothetical protein